MKLLTYTVDTNFSYVGEEHPYYCQKCQSKLRAGSQLVLFCPKCKTIEEPNTTIEHIMSCIHCEQPATIMLNQDGRRTCRCETKDCNDLWSMQDLCLIGLEKSIGEPSLGPNWISLKKLNYRGAKKEILAFLTKNDDETLVQKKFGQTFIRASLNSLIQFEYNKLKKLRLKQNYWFWDFGLALRYRLKSDDVMKIIDNYAATGCPAAVKKLIKQKNGRRFIHAEAVIDILIPLLGPIKLKRFFEKYKKLTIPVPKKFFYNFRHPIFPISPTNGVAENFYPRFKNPIWRKAWF